MADGGAQRSGKTRQALMRTTKNMPKHTANRKKSILKGRDLSHTHKHHHSAVRPRARGFAPPHNKLTHRQQLPTMKVKRPTATASSTVPRPTAYSHSPAANTMHTEQAITQRAARKSDSASIHDAATTFPAIPPTMEFDAQPKEVTGGASHPQEEE
ncbi:exo-alpha-sialidase [Trypanosoma cruzi]|uniref:Uncharacterized protein n=1 Tax=Trypanosoma cruzi (strain CL Brener) TaxID=353153 RepID=Q4CZC4_TRYCC|nr:hypothetical protein Tc00.1047053506723.10 [Trypanosoma cruzi]EAN85624.1 hypothetical protein Tc00.1047053506723.10 [Trypanosoma cruzi]RNC39875.1 exo-alpha-sialidase [Trypanosoma cruzi]|eukprot:XP_807475.1 hypothetical protein [Trypanosoma cruzi strain CL Brener]